MGLAALIEYQSFPKRPDENGRTRNVTPHTLCRIELRLRSCFVWQSRLKFLFFFHLASIFDSPLHDSGAVVNSRVRTRISLEMTRPFLPLDKTCGFRQFATSGLEAACTCGDTSHVRHPL
eukprot:31397-Pelagococcus_subviridis.AAC.11